MPSTCSGVLTAARFAICFLLAVASTASRTETPLSAEICLGGSHLIASLYLAHNDKRPKVDSELQAGDVTAVS